MTDKPVPKRRGFACMSPERLREIASKGGKNVPGEKRTFSLDRQLAASAGKKGGVSVESTKRAFSVNRELAVAAGKMSVKPASSTAFEDAV